LALPESRQLRQRSGEHQALLKACTANDPEAAGLVLRNHLATPANNIAARMDHAPLYEVQWQSPDVRRQPRRRGA
jgi:DNA-binding GntR family transcriptional regulator